MTGTNVGPCRLSDLCLEAALRGTRMMGRGVRPGIMSGVGARGRMKHGVERPTTREGEVKNHSGTRAVQMW